VREINFINTNHSRWKETEAILSSKRKKEPEMLSRLFIQLTDDLAYSKTYYPDSQTTAYLNELTMLAHQHLSTTKKNNLRQIYKFYQIDYPLLLHKNYKKLLYAFIIFITAVLIGILSCAQDPDFARLIMGDGYINMTIENIENGNPLGVYEDSSPFAMFVQITLNNIKVALVAFAYGILFSVGTGYILLSNGIMLGAFQYFFHSKNLLITSMMGIWMHGTIEIFSIVVAGAAGLVMGNSLLFPGTYPRKYSFQKGALEGVKIVAGLIPFFIIAGFIESYLTRLYQINWLSLLVIGLSVLMITYYFFIYPIRLNKRICKQNSI